MTACCPKCGGTEGYEFHMRETHLMNGSWDGEYLEAGDSGGDVWESLPWCSDCGARFRMATVRRVIEQAKQK